MPFKFLIYLQPTNYLCLKNNSGNYVFPKLENLPEDIKLQLHEDLNFKTKLARHYDLSWQAIRKGYIGHSQPYKNFKDVPVYDNYVFARKYFHSAWVFFTLIIRLITFHNPINEIISFLNTRHIKKNPDFNSIKHESIKNFNSNLLIDNPKISIIIPTLNRYKYLRDVLEDLEKQVYTNFEVIVVDQSDEFELSFYNQFKLDIVLIRQKEKALWLARNRAIVKANSDYILLFDDDSRVDQFWIINHIKCLDYFDTHISSGVSFSKKGSKIPDNYFFYRIADQIDTGNVMLKKNVFKKVGLFDRQFEKQRMGDGEFGHRCYLYGFKNISNPQASRYHLKVKSGGLREMGSWDAFRPTNWFAPRPIPSVIYYYRRYFGHMLTIMSLIKSVPPSILSYKYKSNKVMLILGTLISIIILPFILLQVIWSWRLANNKIKQGPLIEKFG